MAIPKSKREANNKWDKENMITLGCKVKRYEGEIFKEYALQQGKKANSLLKEFVLKCNEEYLKYKEENFFDDKK